METALKSESEYKQMCKIVYKKNLKDKLTRHLNIKIDSTVKERHMLMGFKIAMFLEILSDGKWHGIEELQQLVELNENQVQEIAAFLYEYDFARMDVENKKLRINRHFQEFLTQNMTR